MKSFQSYLREREVVSVSKDPNQAKFLIEDADRRFRHFTEQRLTDENCKYVFENCYESIRQLLDAILAVNGYHSYSHQASIVFARDRNIITDKEAIIIDSARALRNDSKYYGTQLILDYVNKTLPIMFDIYHKLKAAVN